ncbi:MAG TPA: hypothetical protein VMT00_02960 [Thermoanaerobaculia bacterium]|nr:hypothetical protein [Thermoanaerobaculia bacterium]
MPSRPADRRMMNRWTRRVLAAFLLLAVFTQLHSFFSRKFLRVTGEAAWIWREGGLGSAEPAAFFAVRDFDLPELREPVRLEVAGDPEYTLWVNGTEVGGGREERRHHLDVYDIRSYVREGSNRIVVALRSGNGVGGFLLALDASRTRENFVVSDGSWKIFTEWHDDLPVRDPEGLVVRKPHVIGKPPIGRWNYLEPREREAYAPIRSILHPLSATRFSTSLPEIKRVSGVMIVASRPARAIAFDFGPTEGRGRLELPGSAPDVVLVRFANDPSELRSEGTLVPFVPARGEPVVIDPAERRFRYIVVYDADVEASVVAAQKTTF